MSGLLQFIGRPVLAALTPQELRLCNSPRQLYELREPFTLRSPDHGEITVPAGFVSDFASVPRAALWYVDDDDPAILYGSIIHDYIYSQLGHLAEDRILTRAQADALLRQTMLACGARPAQAWVVYQAVRLGGAAHWKS
eukprot:gene7180-biopygen6304